MPIAGSESVISYVLRVGGGAGADVRSSITDEDCAGLPCVRAVAGRQHGLGGHFIPRGGAKAVRAAESGVLARAAIVDVTSDAARS